MAAIVVVIYGMQAAKVLLVPFLLAVFLAMIAVRPMLWLQEHRIRPAIAVILIVFVMMMILGTIGTVVGSSIAEFTQALPTYRDRLDTIIDGTVKLVARMTGGEEESLQQFGDLIDPGWAMGQAATVLNALQDVLTNTFLILFTMVFILLEASGFGTKVSAAFATSAESLKKPRQFLSNIGRYLGIKTLVSMATGLCAGIITWMIGLDFPLLWGMLAFLFNYIPAIGSIIAAVPAVLLALIQLGGGEAMLTAIGFLGINIMFGNLLEPRLMGYGVGISPLIVFVGLVFWGWVFGPVGMLLSVPLTMTLKMAMESDDRTRWAAILIGSERDAEYAVAMQMRNDTKKVVKS